MIQSNELQQIIQMEIIQKIAPIQKLFFLLLTVIILNIQLNISVGFVFFFIFQKLTVHESSRTHHRRH